MPAASCGVSTAPSQLKEARTVVEQDINAAELVDNGGDCSVHAGAAADVALHVEWLAGEAYVR